MVTGLQNCFDDFKGIVSSKLTAASKKIESAIDSLESTPAIEASSPNMSKLEIVLRTPIKSLRHCKVTLERNDSLSIKDSILNTLKLYHAFQAKRGEEWSRNLGISAYVFLKDKVFRVKKDSRFSTLADKISLVIGCIVRGVALVAAQITTHIFPYLGIALLATTIALIIILGFSNLIGWALAISLGLILIGTTTLADELKVTHRSDEFKLHLLKIGSKV